MATILCGLLLSLTSLHHRVAWAEGDSITHTVSKGENLFRISLRYGVPMSSILKANSLTESNYIRAGQVLIIPKSDSPSTSNPSLGVTPPNTAPAMNGQHIIHFVERGENLFRISLRYQVDLHRLMEANGITDANSLKAGQRLIIPVASQAPATNSAQASLPRVPQSAEPSSDDGAWDGVFRITYYCLNGFMSSGRWVYSGAVAADRSVLALGRQLVIDGLGRFTVEDRFAWDAGQKRLDVWVPTCFEAIKRGVEYRKVRVLR